MARFLTLALTLTLASTALAQGNAVTPAPAAPIGNTVAPVAPPASAEAPAAEDEPSRFIWGLDFLATGDYSVAAANAVTDGDDETAGAPGYVGGGVNVNLGVRLFDGADKNGVPYGLIAGYRLTVEYKDGIDALEMPGFLITQRHQIGLGFHLGGRNLIEIGAGGVASSGPGGTMGGYSVFFQGHLGGSRGVGMVIGINADVYASEELEDGTHPVAMNMFLGIGWRGISP